MTTLILLTSVTLPWLKAASPGCAAASASRLWLLSLRVEGAVFVGGA